MSKNSFPLALSCCVVGVTLLIPSAQAAAVITDGLVGEYSFESGDASDSGTIGDGTNVGAPTFTTTDAGRSGTVANLSPGNYVTIADSPDVPSGMEARTVSLWVQTSVFGNESAPFRSGNAGPNGVDFSIEYVGTSFGEMKINGWNRDVSFNTTGDPNGFHHVVAAYTGGVDGNFIAYFDGVEVANETVSDINTAANGLRFGGPRIGRTSNDDATQSIDDVLVYDRVLSAAEVTTLFNADPIGVPEPSTALLSLLGVFAICRRRR